MTDKVKVTEYKTMKELKQDRLFKKEDLELVLAYRSLERINVDLLPKGKDIRFEDVNYLMRDSKNDYYLLCVVSDLNNCGGEPYQSRHYVVGEVNVLQIHVIGYWTDEDREKQAFYDYFLPKGRDAHKVVFDMGSENEIRSKYFNIEEFTGNESRCRTDIQINPYLTNRINRRKMRTEDLFGMARKRGLRPDMKETFENLYYFV